MVFVQSSALCRWCGMVSADSPHAHTEQCILALEAEIRRLSELVKRVSAEGRSPPGNAHRTDSVHRKVDKKQ